MPHGEHPWVLIANTRKNLAKIRTIARAKGKDIVVYVVNLLFLGVVF